VWTANASQTSTLLLEIAGNKDINSFGIYDLVTKKTLQIFAGTVSGITTKTVTYSGGIVSLGSDNLTVGSSFGFYLQSGSGPTYYSRVSDNGTDGDHMVTQRTSASRTLLASSGLIPSDVSWGTSEYLLGWEDIPLSSGDKDYQDMLVKVDAVPVPEPTTMIAGALLLLPFGASTLRILRKRKV
jgi:hypothetical protein